MLGSLRNGQHHLVQVLHRDASSKDQRSPWRNWLGSPNSCQAISTFTWTNLYLPGKQPTTFLRPSKVPDPRLAKRQTRVRFPSTIPYTINLLTISFSAVAKDSDASLSTRAQAAGDALGDKVDQHSHEVSNPSHHERLGLQLLTHYCRLRPMSTRRLPSTRYLVVDSWSHRYGGRNVLRCFISRWILLLARLLRRWAIEWRQLMIPWFAWYFLLYYVSV